MCATEIDEVVTTADGEVPTTPISDAVTTPTDAQESVSKKRKIIKNYFYSTLYQIYLIIVPVIVTPYVSRVLRPDGIGQFGFSQSLVSYFTLFAALGFYLYGQREIAKHQGDKFQQSKIIYEITIVRAFTVLACLLVNLLLAWLGVYGMYTQYMLILSINIFAVLIDFNFYLEGNEEFKKLAVKNFLIKTLSLVSIFLFVKSEAHVWVYVLILSLSTITSNFISLYYLSKNLCKIPLKSLKPTSRIIPALKLFLPAIVTSIYAVLDKLLIGLILKDNTQNGFYYQSDRIISIVLTVVTSLSGIMVSRNSNEYQKQNKNALDNNLCFASKIMMFVGLPIMFGLIAVARNMNSWFFGAGYEEVINLMMSVSPIIILIGLRNITGTQYLIVVGKEKIFTITFLVGVITNCILNVILISFIGVEGAVIASVVSECLIVLLQMFILRKEIPIWKMLFAGWKNFIAALIMFGVVWSIQFFLYSSLWHTLLLVVTGMVIYLVACLLLRDELLLSLLKNLKKKKPQDKNKF